MRNALNTEIGGPNNRGTAQFVVEATIVCYTPDAAITNQTAFTVIWNYICGTKVQYY